MSATSPQQVILDEEEEIERLRARWLGLGLSTAPADRPAAERAIADLYRALGLAPPGRCIWARSPLQGAAAATTAQFLSPWMPAQVRAAEWARDRDGAPGEVMAAIRQALAGRGAADDWEPLREETWVPRRSGSPEERVWGFGSEAWAPIRARLGRRFGGEAGGRLVVTSQATPNQARNLEDARAKVAALVRAALVAPRRRVKTAPSAGAHQRRLTGEMRRGAVKRWRARPGEGD